MKPLSVQVSRLGSRLELIAEEQDCLIRAIQSAIEVSRPDEFHAWLGGPFWRWLPHEFVVCVELHSEGGTRVIAGMPRIAQDAAVMDWLCDPARGMAIRLARAYRHERRQSCVVQSPELDVFQGAAGFPAGVPGLHNAAIHRMRMLSGATFSCVLFNLPTDQLERCRYRFRLVAAHLKMALSRVLPPVRQGLEASLTAREVEVLQCMIQGKSNREISHLLGISAITLKNHVSKLYRKLDVQSRNEAVLRGRDAVTRCLSGST